MQPKTQETINALNEQNFVEIHEKLDLILAQTTKTNGRVTSLETWKAWTTGLTLALWLIAVPLILYIVNREFQMIETHIAQNKNVTTN